MELLKQTNVENFRTRTDGKYKGMMEGRAQWLENLERHYFPNKSAREYDNLKARDEKGEIGNERS
ncbi:MULTISPECIES: hypothetical protein [Streptococcus]|uniref:hypothetical protein n=1 Tax=Streptococcus TaxID=1301 RepID=UPI0012DCAB29|nr:hypothetical protein [Streptococcus ruminantium]